jgi:hypothetical protein
MSRHYAKLATWAQGTLSAADAIQEARRIWAIGEEEGYWSERGQLAADATHVAAASSEYVSSLCHRGWLLTLSLQ